MKKLLFVFVIVLILNAFCRPDSTSVPPFAVSALTKARARRRFAGEAATGPDVSSDALEENRMMRK